MNNIRVIFFGTSDFTIPVLQKLQENFTVVGIVTAPDKKVGRKQILTPSPIKAHVCHSGESLQDLRSAKPESLLKQNSGCVRELTYQNDKILILTPENWDDKTIQQIRDLNPSLFIVASYGKIIPQEILDIPKYGALNVHPSCLPKYRGASPIQNAILNGDQTICLSIIQMDEKMDHGPVIFTKEFALSHNNNFQTLSTKLFSEAAVTLPAIITDFVERKTNPQSQNDSKATFTNLIKKEDGYFDINNLPSPDALDRLIRAYYPWPTAWTKWNDKVVKFYPEGLVQIEGKTAMKLEDFLRGYPNFPIKQL